MINIFDTLRQRSEQKQADAMEYLSRDYIHSKDNVIYVAGVPMYTIADTSAAPWQVTPSEAEAIIARMRKAFKDCGGGNYYR